MNFIRYQRQNAAALKGVLLYISQANKASISRENLDTQHWQKGCRLPCAENPVHLVSGKDCVAENAFAEFVATKASFNKTGNVQFYHYTQSFKSGEHISPQTAHEIALRFAEENYKDFEVVVATHTDREHLHSHFIINSVSFETGKKLHQPPDTLRTLRHSSDEICKEYGLSVLPTYTHGKSQTPCRAERRAREQGRSWKENLRKTIDATMQMAHTKEQFIELLQRKRVETKWTDARKSITYTLESGKSCRDNKLQDVRYLKENMEKEFAVRLGKLAPHEVKTGWEPEREVLYFEGQQATQTPTLTPFNAGDVFTRQLLWHAANLEQGMDDDDELQVITELSMLTALSFAGVYVLLETVLNQDKLGEPLQDEEIFDFIDILLCEPEYRQGYEDTQEEQGFSMTMGGL